MKTQLSHLAKAGVAVAAAIAVTGCGTPAAKDFGGRWKSVNQFQKDTTEIPLAQPYVFFPAPMDGTLKAMLTRWSKDTGLLLSYQMPSDFTLTAAAARIHTPNLRAAAAELNAVYAPQGVSISVNQRQIVVQPLATPTPDAPPRAPSEGAADRSAI